MRFLKVSSWDDLKLPRSFGDLPPSDRVLGCGCAGYSVKLMRHKAKLHSRFTHTSFEYHKESVHDLSLAKVQI